MIDETCIKLVGATRKTGQNISSATGGDNIQTILVSFRVKSQSCEPVVDLYKCILLTVMRYEY